MESLYEWAVGIIFYKLCANTENPFPNKMMINLRTEREKAQFIKTHKLTFPSNYFKDKGLP